MLAPAKINLALHVTGQRADGYHLLDSLVVFADVGDKLTAVPKGFEVTGPFAGALEDTPPEDNLVLRAAETFAMANGTPAKAIGFHLEKNLPVASGIGGGSADCAAALKLMNGWFNKPFTDAALAKLGLTLGADVPVCVVGQPTRMEGVGEALSPLPSLPDMAVVLVNPGVAVSTPAVFKALPQKDNAPMALPDNWPNYGAFLGWLTDQRNDLEAPAISQASVIADVLDTLKGADLARMSGSGATVFGLFDTIDKAKAMAADIAQSHRDWWVTPAAIQRPAL